jgi:hypothetical protein
VCFLHRELQYNDINQCNALFLNILISNFVMSSTRFELEGSSTGRLLYIQL